MITKFSRILIVDDSAAIRKVVRKMLNELGLDNLDEAANGVAALDMLNVRNYALVVSDWNMHPMSGLELFNALRVSRTRSIPFIMMTAHAVKFAEVAREGGINYLTKPFTRDALFNKLRLMGLTAVAA